MMHQNIHRKMIIRMIVRTWIHRYRETGPCFRETFRVFNGCFPAPSSGGRRNKPGFQLKGHGHDPSLCFRFIWGAELFSAFLRTLCQCIKSPCISKCVRLRLAHLLEGRREVSHLRPRIIVFCFFCFMDYR